MKKKEELGWRRKDLHHKFWIGSQLVVGFDFWAEGERKEHTSLLCFCLCVFA